MLLFSAGLGAALGFVMPGLRGLLAVVPLSLIVAFKTLQTGPFDGWFAFFVWVMGNLALFEIMFLLGCLAHGKVEAIFSGRSGARSLHRLQRGRQG